MSRTIVSKRYAQALYDAASADNIVADIEQDLVLILRLVDMDDSFRMFLEHPGIEKRRKYDVLEQAISNHVSPLVMNTLRLMIAKGREKLLRHLLDHYTVIANRALGQEVAVIYSAKKLSEGELAQISSVFSSITGKTIKATHVVDSSLIGGLRVRIGDKLYDGSVSRQLEKISQQLTAKAL